MELIELKSVWDVVVKDTISKERVDDFVVTKSIKKDSKSVLNKIKRVIYFKFFLGGLSLILCAAVLCGSFIKPEEFTFYKNIFSLSDNRIFLGTIVVYITAMLSWNFKAFQEISRFETTTASVKESLMKFINIMEKTIQLNIYSGAAFNALALGWVFYLINSKKGFFMDTIEIVLMTTLVMVVGVILSFFMSRFEQKLKFGKNLDVLKENLADLAEEK